MLKLDSLPAATAALIGLIKDDPDIGRFLLIGGTAAALHHGHRVSEDLDFNCVETSLPLVAVNAILDRLGVLGCVMTPITSKDARLYWANDGDDIDRHQQDWAVSVPRHKEKVKLTFFASDSRQRGEWLNGFPQVQYGSIRILASDAIFEMKSRLLARRSMSRDLFDVWYYCTHAGKSIDSVFDFVKAENRHYDDELIKNRLVPSSMSRLDPGFQTNMPGAPQTFQELVAALQLLVDDYEQRIVAQLVRQEISPGP